MNICIANGPISVYVWAKTTADADFHWGPKHRGSLGRSRYERGKLVFHRIGLRRVEGDREAYGHDDTIHLFLSHNPIYHVYLCSFLYKFILYLHLYIYITRHKIHKKKKKPADTALVYYHLSPIISLSLDTIIFSSLSSKSMKYKSKHSNRLYILKRYQ